MKNVIPFLAVFLFTACAGMGKQDPMKGLLDSSSTRPPLAIFELPEIRLGDIRYLKDRSKEREVLAWHFTPRGEFRRGVARQDLEDYHSFNIKIYEVGEVESGRFRGRLLERWDVQEALVFAEARPEYSTTHYYFLRSNEELVHLPAMTKGGNREPVWKKGEKEVIPFLRDRWHLGIRSDAKFLVQELRHQPKVQIPQEGVFTAAAQGESIAVSEMRMGRPSVIASMGKGKEVLRVPGDWIVLLYPDGLAVPLKRN